MKKIILSSIFAFALLAAAGFGVNKSKNNDSNLSKLVLQNVLALADVENPDSGEQGGGYSCSIKMTCFDKVEISCTGLTKCTYGTGGILKKGYVCCDDNYTYCQG